MFKRVKPPRTLARWFINRVDRDAGAVITHLKVHKLLYYAQAWALANFNKSIFTEDMQAWTHGPVVPSVWQKYRNSGWQALPPESAANLGDENLENYLEIVFERYAKYSAKELERMTHNDDPWRKTRGILPLEARCTSPIDKNLIRDFYAARINKSWN